MKIEKHKWYTFVPRRAANRQQLPPEKKYVLVELKNLDPGFPNPICVGYLKYHAGVLDEPYFVTPGASIPTYKDDFRVLRWCDCLPDDFKWYDWDHVLDCSFGERLCSRCKNYNDSDLSCNILTELLPVNECLYYRKSKTHHY